jgi:hypothetical protein
MRTVPLQDRVVNLGSRPSHLDSYAPSILRANLLVVFEWQRHCSRRHRTSITIKTFGVRPSYPLGALHSWNEYVTETAH